MNIPVLVHQTYHFLRRMSQTCWHHFWRTNCFDRAASMAYSTLLAFMPTLVIGLWLTELGHFSPSAIHRALTLILRPLSIEATNPLTQHLIQFVLQTKSLSWLMYFCLACSTMLLVRNLHVAFDAIWDVQTQKRKPHLTLLHAITIMLLPMLLTWLTSIETWFIASHQQTFFFVTLRQLFDGFNLGIWMLLLSCCYAMLPSTSVSFGAAWWSSTMISCCMSVAKKTLSWYFSVAKSYSLLYGSLQAIPIFLLWIYVVWMLILAGCALCRSMHATSWRTT